MKDKPRDGKTNRSLIIAIVAVLLLGIGAVYSWRLFAGSSVVEIAPQMTKMKTETFIHEITERGSVESASNTDITCEVESVGGITIIWLVPEGTDVKEGDPLVEFDSSTFTEQVNKQEIAFLNAQAKVSQSEADLENAKLDLEEYVEGKYLENEKTADNKILQAKETMRTAEDNLRYSRNLFARGYITESEVEANEFALQKATNDLAVAEMERKNLEEYTRKKTVNTFEAKVRAVNAKLESDKRNLNLEESRLKHLQKQLDQCKVSAPQDGQVVYAPPRWGDESEIIREGKKVYERQQIIKLPDPTKMQVKGLVNEASIRLVKVGDPATVELEAFPNKVFKGVVKVVNDYPEPTGWNSTSMSREYQTTVTILDPPPGIKPGLTAKVKIVVNVIPNANTLPIQAVFDYGGKMYCVTFKDGKWDKKEVQTGPTNEKQVVIESGLDTDEMVVLNAWQNREKLNLPKLEKAEPPVDPEEMKMMRREQGGDTGPKPEGRGGDAGSRPEGRGGDRDAKPAKTDSDATKVETSETTDTSEGMENTETVEHLETFIPEVPVTTETAE